MRLESSIIVTSEPKKVLESLLALKTNEIFTIIDTEDKEFLVEDASKAIAKAFVASEVDNFIVLIAPRFSVISQNRLLKIIEEPPPNKYFILITKSKSSILSTIKSRLPITNLHDNIIDNSLDLDIENLNLAKIYEFIHSNNRLSTVECKVLIEKIAKIVIKSSKYNLDDSLLELFSNSIKALEVGSPTSFILNTILLKLLEKKKK